MSEERKGAQIFYYVPKSHAHEFLELGWIKHGSLEGTPHGHFSILMEWTKDDNPQIPKMERAV